MAIRIVTDSTCDLPAEIIDRHGIRVLPMLINRGDEGFRDGVDITRADFYRSLPDWPVAPTTAAPSPAAFRAIYRELAAEGATQVLSIHISRSLSAVMDVAEIAARETTEVPVEAFDSQQLSLGTGFLVQTAAELAEQGAALDQIRAQLHDQIERTRVFAALDTLEFLRRSGRMSGVMAGLGSMLQLKPILKMHAGEATSERIRTSAKAHRRVLDLLREQAPIERLALLHTHAEAEARRLSEAAGDLAAGQRVWAVDITPVIGAHIGPGAVGFATISAK